MAIRTLLLQPVGSQVGKRIAQRTDVIVCQNSEVYRRFKRRSRKLIFLEPNAGMSQVRPASKTGKPGKHALVACRLLPWKGVALAIEAVLHTQDWSLTIIGSGPDASRLRKLVRRRGAESRITFIEELPREVFLERLRTADAFLFPSLHDSGPWVVAEAASIGVPTITLDLGGPPLLAAPGASIAVSPRKGGVIRRIAAALDNLPQPRSSDRWGTERIPMHVQAWYNHAASQHSSSGGANL